MQQNYLYPQIYMVDGNPNINPCVTAPAWSLQPLKKKRKLDWRNIGTILILFLVLLALAGVALGTMHIMQLQKELNELKQVNTAREPRTEKQIGFRNLTVPVKQKEKAAHLTGKSFTGDSKTIMWEDSLGHAFTRGIQYKDRGLLINETGLFFIYSKVYFRGQICQKNMYLEHNVFKRTERYPKDIILMEMKTLNPCTGNGARWIKNSYEAGIFQLSKGESVYVNVSRPELVSFDESKTFFGLYKL
ncbi:tumor necrosis factor ligand superfamily member 6-like [Callorhinchus milii]|uniref:Tumor necrosis factor ligand superfamily member 6 n=1 Tax=Callorhinchus milii TaxID=7868 RepID=A0A4W3K0U9_CALMI|nr:Fas ligand member a [Callorhinchus milii]|eukprot:gi/632956122/ref/XP_007893802.1/ PREDICTED: tumor necrosis factor ligand superfamily member 6-like [Callorhinchus milii]